MIAVGETNEYAAEIPFFLPKVSNPVDGKTGHVFVLGEVRYKFIGDSAFTDVPLARIREIGFGWYVIRLTLAQCASANVVAYSVNCADAQPENGTETIDVLGGDIAQNGEGVIPFFLANELDPIYGPPVTGVDWGGGSTTSMLKLRLPDGVLQDAAVGDIVERGNGMYWLRLGESKTAKRGKAFLVADVPGAQPFGTYRTILGAGSLSVGGGIVVPSPVPSPIVKSDPLYVDHVEVAIDRLLQQFKERIDA